MNNNNILVMNNSNILVIYHHKTGCVLARNLFNIYKKYLNDYFCYRNNIKIENTLKNNKIIKNSKFNLNNLKNKFNIFLQASPLFLYDIKKELKFNKIIHFVRNPYEQAISNFNYHIQEPTPEIWFLNIHNQVYKWFSRKNYLEFMFQILDLDLKLIKEIELYLKNIYTSKSKLNYYNNLLEINKKCQDTALIIETLRFIIDTKHILNMACITKLNKNNIYLLNFDDFKKDNIKKTINNLNTFIFPDENIDNENLIKFYLKKYNIDKNSNHISKISEEIKLKQINVLKNNIYIKTIFDKVIEILY